MMRIAKDASSVKRWMDDYNSKNFYNQLKSNNQIFDQILISLEEMMEKKRDIFPRFYFISNEELLSILSTCKQPS